MTKTRYYHCHWLRQFSIHGMYRVNIGRVFIATYLVGTTTHQVGPTETESCQSRHENGEEKVERHSSVRGEIRKPRGNGKIFDITWSEIHIFRMTSLHFSRLKPDILPQCLLEPLHRQSLVDSQQD